MTRPILLFPGQGSQCAGMGRELAEADSDAMDLWKKAERISHLPLREIFWEGDEAAMSDTMALQPALTVVNCTLWKCVRGKVSPMGAAGHSLGEFSALACAKVLELEDALEVTALRGKLMSQADPDHSGSMAAVVKLDVATVEEIVKEAAVQSNELLLAANFNAPLQTVISGTKAAVALACAKVKEKKGRALPLKVSAAFHSPMMAEANAEFAPLLKRLTWHTAQFPVYGNVDGKPELSGERLLEKMLLQMVSPVRWIDTVLHQYADGARTWLELGPKSLLNKMVASCLEDTESVDFVSVTDRNSAGAISFGEDYAGN